MKQQRGAGLVCVCSVWRRQAWRAWQKRSSNVGRRQMNARRARGRASRDRRGIIARRRHPGNGSMGMKADEQQTAQATPQRIKETRRQASKEHQTGERMFRTVEKQWVKISIMVACAA